MTRTPIGDLAVARERHAVRLDIEWTSGQTQSVYIKPERAVEMALMLQRAAAEAKRYEQIRDGNDGR